MMSRQGPNHAGSQVQQVFVSFRFQFITHPTEFPGKYNFFVVRDKKTGAPEEFVMDRYLVGRVGGFPCPVHKPDTDLGKYLAVVAGEILGQTERRLV